MFVHTVFFWLKDGLTKEQHESFAGGLESLRQIDHVGTLYAGRSIPSDRAVVDHSYHFGLIVLFDDQKSHDAYQVDPIHDTFVDDFSPLFERVVVHDTNC